MQKHRQMPTAIGESPSLYLFVPGDRPERFTKAASSGADAVIVDLEDAVAEVAKATARQAARRALVTRLACPVIVRINARKTPHFADDLAALEDLPIAGLMLPKAEDDVEIRDLRCHLPDGAAVIALVESAEGLANARELAGAADRLAFGSLDFAASIGAAHCRCSLLAARSELVLASALAMRPPPIDGVTTSVDEAVPVEDDAAYASSLGFGGKLLIHPRQIAPTLRGFAPPAEAVEKARRMLAASSGEAVKLDGQMVDLPVIEAARRQVELGARIEARLSSLAGWST